MVRWCSDSDFETIYAIINDAAIAYKGVIPDDRWHEPYMSRDQLREEIKSGVIFWGYELYNELLGVMGYQPVRDLTLIRHAYVKTRHRKQGIGTRLIESLLKKIEGPVLIGTWADAVWAISFYKKGGFTLVTEQQKNELLQKYWNIPMRQVETSVVLANQKWFESI